MCSGQDSQVAGWGVWSWNHLIHHGQKASNRLTVWREVLTNRTFLVGSLSTLGLSTNVTQQDTVIVPLSLLLELTLPPLRAQYQLGSQGEGDRIHFSVGSPQPTVCRKCQWHPLSFTLLSSSSVMPEELCCSLLTAGAFNVCKLKTRSKLTWQK